MKIKRIPSAEEDSPEWAEWTATIQSSWEGKYQLRVLFSASERLIERDPPDDLDGESPELPGS